MQNNVVEIYCKNLKKKLIVPMGASLMDIYKQANVQLPYRVISARVNYKTEDLNYPVFRAKDVEFVDASSRSGRNVYLRTLSMVMAMAVHQLYPKAVLRIEHPLSKGYFCSIDGRKNVVDKKMIEAIKQRMREIVKADYPIHSKEKQTSEVIELFKTLNQPDRVVLLETLGLTYARYFQIEEYIDYFIGVLAPSTGYVDVFDLESYANGILLVAPDNNIPTQLSTIEDHPKMFDIFNEFVRWNKIMGLSNVGDFNKLADSQSVYDMIKISEALHERCIAGIADKISQRENVKFIMISGPSSSGKTTFSKRLSVQLSVIGIKPVVLSMDNYFVNRVDTPLDENGNWDFESLYAVDLELFNDQLTRLLKGEEVDLPTFNFEDGCRHYYGNKLKMTEGMVLVIEGIHALNPKLTEYVPKESMFNIYISALTTISLDNHTWISTQDTRLLRRIVRDYKFRNFSAQETIHRWPSVRKGEEKWIYPYEENADAMFNSALLFELAVLRTHAEPILAQVPQRCEEYTEAHRLLNFLKYFRPVKDNEIPPTSLLREFLGGSSFR